MLGITPEHCVVFEDAEAGIEAAKAGNMFAVGIGNQEMLKEADVVVEGLSVLDYNKFVSLLNCK